MFLGNKYTFSSHNRTITNNETGQEETITVVIGSLGGLVLSAAKFKVAGLDAEITELKLPSRRSSGFAIAPDMVHQTEREAYERGAKALLLYCYPETEDFFRQRDFAWTGQEIAEGGIVRRELCREIFSHEDLDDVIGVDPADTAVSIEELETR